MRYKQCAPVHPNQLVYGGYDDGGIHDTNIIRPLRGRDWKETTLVPQVSLRSTSRLNKVGRFPRPLLLLKSPNRITYHSTLNPLIIPFITSPHIVPPEG